MKRSIYIILFAASLCVTYNASAQMKTSYFMEGSIQRLDMNAAFLPQRGYVNIPFVGNLGIGLNSNFLSVRNFLYPNPDGNGLVTFMHGSVGSDDFLRRMRNKNHATVSLNENLFGFGGYERRYFWSFGINLRSETSFTIPKEFFELAKELREGEYNLKGFDASSDNYMEFAVGFVFPVSRDINVGFRVKGLLGAAHASLDVQSMDVSVRDDEWRADMRGTFSGNVMGMDFSHLSGQMPIDDVFSDLGDFNMNKIGSWGLAFDIGADARFLNDRLKVSVGLNDLGFIAWSKKSAVNGSFDNLSASFRGYDYEKEDADVIQPDSVMVTVSAQKSTAKMLTATLNIGGEYTILDDAIGFGLLSQTRFYGDYTSTELTVSANFRPSPWFTASLSHSLIQNRLGVIGFALNVHPSWINFFLGVDYFGFHYGKYKQSNMLPINMKSANFYFGLAVPMCKPKVDGRFKSNLAYYRNARY